MSAPLAEGGTCLVEAGDQARLVLGAEAARSAGDLLDLGGRQRPLLDAVKLFQAGEDDAPAATLRSDRGSPG